MPIQKSAKCLITPIRRFPVTPVRVPSELHTVTVTYLTNVILIILIKTDYPELRCTQCKNTYLSNGPKYNTSRRKFFFSRLKWIEEKKNSYIYWGTREFGVVFFYGRGDRGAAKRCWRVIGKVYGGHNVLSLYPENHGRRSVSCW